MLNNIKNVVFYRFYVEYQKKMTLFFIKYPLRLIN